MLVVMVLSIIRYIYDRYKKPSLTGEGVQVLEDTTAAVLASHYTSDARTLIRHEQYLHSSLDRAHQIGLW
jgi:hypothetical protein